MKDERGYTYLFIQKQEKASKKRKKLQPSILFFLRENGIKGNIVYIRYVYTTFHNFIQCDLLLPEIYWISTLFLRFSGGVGGI